MKSLFSTSRASRFPTLPSRSIPGVRTVVGMIFCLTIPGWAAAGEPPVERSADLVALVGTPARLAESFALAGARFAEIDQLPLAAFCYRQSARIEPDSAARWQELGNVLADQGELEEAIEVYAAAVHLFPRLSGPHYGLSWVLEARARRDDPDSDQVDTPLARRHLLIGQALEELAILDEGIDVYRKAIALDRSRTETLRRLERAVELRRELSSVLDLAFRAIELGAAEASLESSTDRAKEGHSLADAYDRLGRALADAGDAAGADVAFHAAERLFPAICRE
jgi:tetratricopeptide (TPR) repeat protein